MVKLKEFTCTNCGDCCGSVPITFSELQKIRGAVSKMTNKRVEQLRGQKKAVDQCILWDMKTRKCSIYENRPQLCKMFGYYEGMVCSNNPSQAIRSREAGARELQIIPQALAGILSTQIKWEHLVQGDSLKRK